jgi:membrane protease YdiL (CAAX protease family)
MILGHLPIEFSIIASFGPTIAAVVTNRLAYGDYRAFQVNVSWPRTLVASVIGIALVLAAYVIFPALATVDPGKLHWSALASLGVYNYSTLLSGPLFEEPGWRGFALPRLEAHLSPVTASLFLGAVWAAWHLPLFLYPGWTNSPVWFFFLVLSGLSVLMTLGANLARFSVLAPILMHALFNTHGRFLDGLFANAAPGSGGFLNYIVPLIPAHRGGNISISFNALIVTGGLVAALVTILFTKGRLGYVPKDYPGHFQSRISGMSSPYWAI